MSVTEMYLDSAACSPVDPGTAEFFSEKCLEFPANPESPHIAGRRAERSLAEDSERLLGLLGAGTEYRVFRAHSATDALSVFLRQPFLSGGNAVVSMLEHPAVRGPLDFRSDCEIRRPSVLRDGRLDLESFSSLLDGNTRLAVLTHVQSETGAIQDPIRAGRILREKSPRALFLIDTVQSAAKIEIPWGDASPDAALVAGHKIGAPGGAALIHKDAGLGRFLEDARSRYHLAGRVDVAAALTLTYALDNLLSGGGMLFDRISKINMAFRKSLLEMNVPAGFELKMTVSGDLSPYILHFSLAPAQGAILVRMLSKKGIMVSSGSACESEKSGPSMALLAMGCSRQVAYGAVRTSFWKNSRRENAAVFAEALTGVLHEY